MDRKLKKLLKYLGIAAAGGLGIFIVIKLFVLLLWLAGIGAVGYIFRKPIMKAVHYVMDKVDFSGIQEWLSGLKDTLIRKKVHNTVESVFNEKSASEALKHAARSSKDSLNQLKRDLTSQYQTSEEPKKRVVLQLTKKDKVPRS